MMPQNTNQSLYMYEQQTWIVPTPDLPNRAQVQLSIVRTKNVGIYSLVRMHDTSRSFDSCNPFDWF